MSLSNDTHTHVLNALYAAAAVLIEAVTDPVALEQAPLRHRASALNAVSSLIVTLHKFAPAAAPRPAADMRYQWDFGPDPDEEISGIEPQPAALERETAADRSSAPEPVSSSLAPSVYAQRPSDVPIPVPSSASPSASAPRPNSQPAASFQKRHSGRKHRR